MIFFVLINFIFLFKVCFRYIFKINMYNYLELWVFIYLIDNKFNVVIKKVKYIFKKKLKCN